MAAGLYDITNETLGKGHFAIVRLAKHCLTGEFVAVKVIDKTKLNNEGLQQLGLEIHVLSRLSEHQHANIVKLYQVIDTKTKLYLVMEYCGKDVCDLYDYIQRRQSGNGLTESEAKHIFRQICSAISYCHSLRIVHRDLKPENILIVTQPETDNATNASKYPIVKLIDFGFSNQWKEGEKLRTSCGSLAYSAPEILLGDYYDGDKVDIWGLGCILYILLYGSNPFMQINDSETLVRILDCTFSTPSRPTITSSAIVLIRSLLKKDPTSRLTIKQVTALPWLAEEDDQTNQSEAFRLPTDSDNKSNISPVESQTNGASSSTNVHERVIEQMIAQQMCTSREHVERALKITHETVDGSRSTSALVTRTESPINGESERTAPSNDHYITATYNLLKDKLLRELQGITSSSSNVHEIRASLHHKRGHQLRQRNKLTQAPRFVPRFTPMSSLTKTEEKPSASDSSTVSPIEALSEDEPFALPLQRKCSIVSEEGSCAGADLSGHSDAGSDVHTFLIGDEHDPVTVRRPHPPVNIVVTDYSTDDLKDDVPLEDLEFNEVETSGASEESECPPEGLEDPAKEKTVVLGAAAASGVLSDKLHQVSSSPDFTRELDEANEQDRMLGNEEGRSCDAKAAIGEKSRRPVTMILTSDQKRTEQVNDISRHVPTRQQKESGQTMNDAGPSTTSMRVIISSKSCNDILFKPEIDSRGADNPKGGSRKDSHSGSQLLKRNKGDRTDCCTIC